MLTSYIALLSDGSNDVVDRVTAVPVRATARPCRLRCKGQQKRFTLNEKYD
jgi:hypothetical protein